MIYLILYLIVGIIVTWFMIYHYRKDGTTNQKNELYWAAIGVFIFPLQIIMFILNKVNDKKNIKNGTRQ